MGWIRDLEGAGGRLLTAAGIAPALGAAARWGVDGLLRFQAGRWPERPCLRTLDATLTYAEADQAASRVARFWGGRGVGPGDVVALFMGNRLEVLLHQLGLSRLGAASAVLNPHLRGRALAHLLRTSRARALVADAERVEATLACEHPVEAWLGAGESDQLPDLRPELAATPAGEVPPGRKDADSVYTHLFTSGTTGLPKAAPMRHRRLLLVGGAFQVWALREEPGVYFTPLPLYHASAQLIGFSSALVAGGCFAFSPAFHASTYWSEAVAVGATVGLYVGEMCRYLLAAPTHPDERRHGIRAFVGNGLRADVWPAFQARFGEPRVVEFYGATEGNALLINATGKVGSCGRPVPGWPLRGLRLVRYDVESDTHPRDAKGRCVECAPGEVGELVGRVGWLPHERFDGYLDPKATQSKLLRDVFRRGDQWFRSGDLLRRDEDGDFYFVDRIGDTFRWKGENVSTQEVAELLTGAGGAHAVLVYGVPVPGAEGRAGMAAVVCDGPFEPRAFHARAAEALPPYARPAFVRVCGEIETTGTMKFKKTRLQAEGYQETGDALFVRDAAAGTYAPLTPERRAALAVGSLRL